MTDAFGYLLRRARGDDLSGVALSPEDRAIVESFTHVPPEVSREEIRQRVQDLQELQRSMGRSGVMSLEQRMQQGPRHRHTPSPRSGAGEQHQQQTGFQQLLSAVAGAIRSRFSPEPTINTALGPLPRRNVANALASAGEMMLNESDLLDCALYDIRDRQIRELQHALSLPETPGDGDLAFRRAVESADASNRRMQDGMLRRSEEMTDGLRGMVTHLVPGLGNLGGMPDPLSGNHPDAGGLAMPRGMFRR